MKTERELARHTTDLGNDLNDLSALDELAESARIIMLGEQNHGDGASFIFKTRLIDYLHQRHGYTVLAFEADFYALELA